MDVDIITLLTIFGLAVFVAPFLVLAAAVIASRGFAETRRGPGRRRNP